MANDFHFGADMMVFHEPSCQNNDSDDSWSDEDDDGDVSWKGQFTKGNRVTTASVEAVFQS